MGKRKSSEALKVFVRVRPPISSEIKVKNAVISSGNGISVNTEKSSVSCSYDRVFGDVSEQSEVFESIRPLLVDVLNGINGTVFAYGQTSAGKSHTMIGPNGGTHVLRGDPSTWGILPRAAEFLLESLADKEREGLLSYRVNASFMEIYNENITDLLSNARQSMDIGDDRWSDDKDRVDGGLKVREIPRSDRGPALTADDGAPREVYVAGLSEFRVHTASDVMRLVAAGANNRTVRSTDFNDSSSRSHAVLQLSFEIEKRGETGESVLYTSKLSLADLAGSEKIGVGGETMVGLEPTGEDLLRNQRHLRELTSINKSLSCLGNVISALGSSTRTHIPYRESKLTRLLQDSLGGNTRTILIACVAPTEMHCSETVSTLQFADRAKSVMLKVRANAVVDDKAALARANEEIKRLQNLLSKALAKLEGADGGAGDSALAGALRAQAAIANDEGHSEVTKPIGGMSSSGDGGSDREMALLQENAKLQAENERLRGQLRQQGQGNKENREGHGRTRKRQSQSSDSALGGGKQSSKGSNHHNSISALTNRNNSYFAERDRAAGNFKKMHKPNGGGGNAVRVYGSTSSAKLVKSLKAELKAEQGDGSQSPKRSRQAQSHSRKDEQAQYFSGFASAVIAQATGQASDSAEAKKAATLERLNGQVRLNSAEALERFHKRESGLSFQLQEKNQELKGEKAYLDSLTAARESMERQLAELAVGPSKKRRSGSRGSRRGKRNGATAETRRREGEDEGEEGEERGTYTSNYTRDLGDDDSDDDDSGGFLDINGLSAAAAAAHHGPTPAGRADSLRQSVNNASAQQQLPSPEKSPIMIEMEEAGIRSSISSILSPGKSLRSPFKPELGNSGGSNDMQSGQTLEGAHVPSGSTTFSPPSNSPVPASVKASTSSTPPEEDEDEVPLLQHDEGDVGRVLQMFSFLRNDWVDVHVEAFDSNNGAHKISYVDTGKQEWQNLRRKAVRRAE